MQKQMQSLLFPAQKKLFCLYRPQGLGRTTEELASPRVTGPHGHAVPPREKKRTGHTVSPAVPRAQAGVGSDPCSRPAAGPGNRLPRALHSKGTCPR